MPKYAFAGKTPHGKIVKGIMVASDKEQASAKLQTNGIVVLELEEKVAGQSGGLFGLTTKISQNDIVVFTRQFAVMQDAGMGLVDTFEILSEQTKNPLFKQIIQNLKTSVQEGSTLADAMDKYPKYFNELYVNMIRAGELSGSLVNVLNRLADYYERAIKLSRQIKTALVYPSIVIGAACTIVWALLVFVVPIFEKIFKQSKEGLPLPTQILVSASNILRDNLLLSIAVLVALIIGARMYYKTPVGKFNLDTFLLKIPLIGNIVHKVSVSRFTTTLGSLMTCGVPIVDGLELASRATGNSRVAKAVKQATIDVIEGKPLAFSLAKTSLFPSMVLNMVRVGEESGSLDKMLHKVNDFYTDEVDAAIKALTSAMEPLLILGLGSLIAGIVVALYLPVFQLATAMG